MKLALFCCSVWQETAVEIQHSRKLKSVAVCGLGWELTALYFLAKGVLPCPDTWDPKNGTLLEAKLHFLAFKSTPNDYSLSNSCRRCVRCGSKDSKATKMS